MKEIEEILFFTGAGFSKPADCKLSAEMLNELENLTNNDSDHKFLSVEKKTIKFILSCLYYHSRWRTLETNGKYDFKPNIEEFVMLLRRIRNRENLLPYPVTGNWSEKILDLEHEFKSENKDSDHDLYESIEKKIKNKLYPEWLKVSKTDFLNPMSEFFRDNPNTGIKLELFTLNNDLVLEEHFKNENSVYTGFVNHKWVGFHVKANDEDTYHAGRINYYKLHGSIDWVRMIDGTIMINKQNINEMVIDEESSPFLIIGHGNKLFTIDPFFTLLNLFHSKLREKKFFFVIGYSFFDPHINNLFFNELITNPEQDKKLIIVNPSLCNFTNNDFEDKSNEYGFNNVLKKESKIGLVSFIENIQKNSFFSEIPEYNVKKISSDSIVYIKCDSENFISKIFSKNNEQQYILIKFIQSLKEEIRQNREYF